MTGCDLVRILAVRPIAVRGGLSYSIDAVMIEPPNFLKQYTTMSSWRASYCEEARKGEYPIYVSWTDTPYGKKITMHQKLGVVSRQVSA